MIFEFDRYIDGKPYPNCARHEARPYTPEWRQFSQHWPFSEPASLIEYLQEESIAWNQSGPRVYLIALSFFDFQIKWFDIIPKHRIEDLKNQTLYLCFYYSEGDNPQRIREHLIGQCKENNISPEQLLLVSANSSADQLPNSVWFADDELLYKKRNRKIKALDYHEDRRQYLFTALVRTHKWWRATVMADFWRRGWHDLGYFSYNPEISVGEPEEDNPIQIDRWVGLRQSINDFLKYKFLADNLTPEEHNDHHLCVAEHYNNSYLNVVIETHMDVDQSGGVFLTEKTFKPIKHAQPFVIFGAQNSLARLRDLGYRTFDHVIDTQYDEIPDTTERYECLMYILDHMFAHGPDYMYALLQECQEDVLHNQKHFLSSKQARLNSLLERLTCEK